MSANSYSPSAAASASLCRCRLATGRPQAHIARCSSAKKGTSRQPRLGAKRTSPASSSTAPGRLTPTPDNSRPRSVSVCQAWWTSAVACRHTDCTSVLSSRPCKVSSTCPASETDTTRSCCTPISTPSSTRTLSLMCSGMDGRPRPSAATGALASRSQRSSSSSRTRALTVDLVKPLCCDSRARDKPGWLRSRRNNTLRLMRLSSCWSPVVLMARRAFRRRAAGRYLAGRGDCVLPAGCLPRMIMPSTSSSVTSCVR